MDTQLLLLFVSGYAMHSILEVKCQTYEQCRLGFYLGSEQCVRCPIGSYNDEDTHNRTSCTLCPYNNETDRAGSTQDTGAWSIEHCYFEPEIRSFHPNLGPISGGTALEVQMYAFDESYDIVVAFVARTEASVVAVNKTQNTVMLSTRPVNETKNDTIRLTFRPIDKMYETNTSFFYVEDPIVESVNKLKTFVSGGLPIIITGQFLDHVQQPQIFITIVVEGEIKPPIYSACNVEPNTNGTQMICRTPNLRPALTEITNNINRRKRTVEPRPFNNDKWQFYGGFQMDGVTEFRNLSSALPEYGQFQIYDDPEYFPFDGDGVVGYVQIYNPEDIYLNIRGERLNYACDESDVTVRIGKELCNVTNLAVNMLTCLPPPTQPEYDPQTQHGPRETPTVTVYVGNLDFFIGYLEYKVPISSTEEPVAKPSSDKTEDDMFYVILGGSLGLGFLLIIIITILVIIVREKRKKRKPHSHLEARLTQNGGVQQNGRYVSNNAMQDTLMYTQVASDGSGSGNMAFLDDGNNNHLPRQRGRQMSETVSAPPTPDAYGDGRIRSSLDVYFSTAEERSVNVLEQLEESLRLSVNECLIPHEHITLGDVVGAGHFGKVYKSTLRLKGKEDDIEEVVAAKTIQGTNHTLKEVGAFLEEAVVMKDFEHENVLSLIGVAINGWQPMVILPYMSHGDLKLHIRDPTKMMKVKELLGFGKQIARGMTYLTKQKFVHRDLATRNCMLNDNLVVKIADFGLSRDVYKTDYYRVEDKHRPLPVRWMAVESLTSGVFSSKSDVWSFGVCMWELLTRGCSPYPDVDTFNIKQYVCSGRRLSQPEHTPDDVYELMEKCWIDNPDKRPDFTELYDALENILDTNTSDYSTIILPS